MLIYHPAYDIYHTSFRVLHILENSLRDQLEIERVRVYDFILLFPHELHHIKLPVGTTSIRKKFSETAYNKVPSKKKVFNQIKYYFDVSTHCLVSYGALNLEKYQEGFLAKTDAVAQITTKLKTDLSTIDGDLLELFAQNLDKIPLEELKQRFQ